MPWFRFTDDPKIKLRYRNAILVLDFANLQNSPETAADHSDLPDVWAWVAHYEQDPNRRVVITRFGNIRALFDAIRTWGFEVEAGSVAEKIMRAAVKQRLAEDLPDEERWRNEIVRMRTS